jgi:DNA-binding NarL/FixJ family response regulator
MKKPLFRSPGPGASGGDPGPTQPPQDPAEPHLGVALAEHPAVIRAGIAGVLRSTPGLDLLVETGSAEELLTALKALRGYRTVVVIVGLELPGDRTSLTLIRTVRDTLPSMLILACGSHVDESSVSSALFAGADGFVSKNVPVDEFVAAVTATAAGEVVLAGVPDGWLGRIADTIDEPAPSGLTALLTPREVEILAAAADGLTAREIARRLDVAERTITTHFTRIYRKLGARSRIHAINMAAAAGLLPGSRSAS